MDHMPLICHAHSAAEYATQMSAESVMREAAQQDTVTQLQLRITTYLLETMTYFSMKIITL